MAKGMQQKKTAKKKPAKTLMEKRAEKARRRAADPVPLGPHCRLMMAAPACVTGRMSNTAPSR